MKSTRSRPILAAIALAWLFSLPAVYYFVHKPFAAEFVVSLALAGWQVLVAAAIASLGGGIGFFILPDLSFSPVTRAILHLALGLGVVSILILMVGATIGWTPAIAWLLLVSAALLLRRHIVGWWRDLFPLSQIWRGAGRLGRSLAVGSALIVFFELFVALAPPLEFDALVYHLTLPRLYLMNGRISDVPELIYAGFPQSAHMLYAWSMALGAQRAAVLSWTLGAFTIIGLVDYVKQGWNGRLGWVAAASLLAGFSIANSLASAYIDWPNMLMGLAFLISIDRWRKSERARDMLLAGAFAGLSFSVKYSSGILLAAGAAITLWHYRSGLSGAGRPLLQFFGAAGLLASPWLIKNLLITGNPFYPLVFPSGAMDAIRLDFYQSAQVLGDWRDAVLLPIRATFWGIERGRVGNAPNYEISIGPLLLGLGVWAWLGWGSLTKDRRLFTGTAAVTALVGLLIWAIAGRQVNHLIRSHLYFAIFPALAVLASVGFAALNKLSWRNLRVGRLASALLLLTFWLNVTQVGLRAFDLGAPQLLIGSDSEESYRNANLGMFNLAMERIDSLPAEARVVFLWETRGYYCMPKCEPDEIIDRWKHDLSLYSGAEQVLSHWRGSGFSHLLHHQAASEFVKARDERYQASDWGALEALEAQLPVVEQFGEAYTIYSLAP